jgi:hypothetical protein
MTARTRSSSISTERTYLAALSGSESQTQPRFAASSNRGVDNPWFPLRPGTTFVYRGAKDGRAARDVLAVTNRTAEIDGVRYFKGHAEDHFRVLSLAASVRTPATASGHALLTQEWTPLEPGVIDHRPRSRPPRLSARLRAAPP